MAFLKKHLTTTRLLIAWRVSKAISSIAFAVFVAMHVGGCSAGSTGSAGTDGTNGTVNINAKVVVNSSYQLPTGVAEKFSNSSITRSIATRGINNQPHMDFLGVSTPARNIQGVYAPMLTIDNQLSVLAALSAERDLELTRSLAEAENDLRSVEERVTDQDIIEALIATIEEK